MYESRWGSDSSRIQEDRDKVEGYYVEALRQVAFEQGGDKLVDSLIPSDGNGILPVFGAMLALDDSRPGSIEKVMDRVAMLQTQSHRQDVDRLANTRRSSRAKAIISGLVSLASFGMIYKDPT